MSVLIPTIETPQNFSQKLSESFDQFINMFHGKSDKQEKIWLKLGAELSKANEFATETVKMIKQDVLAPKFKKIKEKLLIGQMKLQKNKYWKKMLKATGKIAKGVARLGGNWLFKIIGFLMAMAIFDPKGKLLGSLLKFFVGIFVWFIKKLATYLPMIVSTMITLVVDVLPKLLVSVIQAIFPALEKAFKTMGDNFIKRGFPILGQIVKWMSGLFGKDGVLYNFFMFLAKIAPILLTAFLVIGAIVKIMPALSIAYKVLTTVFGGLQMMMSFLVANPIVAVIIGIAAAFFLIYKYSDKIIAFFDGIWDWFTNLGAKMKVFIGIIAAPLIPFIALIYGLAKLFKSIKKIGVAKTFQLIWKTIKNFFKGAFKKLKKLLKIVLDFFLWPYKMAWKFLKKAGSSIWSLMKSIGRKVWSAIEMIFGGVAKVIFGPYKKIFDSMKSLATNLGPVLNAVNKVLGKIWDLISGTILRVIGWVKEAFLGIGDIFSSIMHYGPIDFFRAKGTEKAAMLASAKLARARGTSLEEVAKRSTRKGAATYRELAKQGVIVKEGNIDVSKATERSVKRIDKTASRLSRVEVTPGGKFSGKRGN